MSNLFSYLDATVEPKRERPPTNGTGTPANGGAHVHAAEQGIRLENVSFRYPGKEAWVLRNVDLFVPRGQSIALVGQNGAGKTTLVKLVTHLYEPTDGRILLDGKDLRDWDPRALLERFGVVFQDFNQYQLKLRENVGVGSVAHLLDEPRIARAVERGGAGGVVSGLESGIETPLGRWFQDGVELSGGQWQKLALARAFMREQADILVLDEPTAALDAEAEHAVFDRFQELAAGRTTIIISHRFPTVRMADRILVLEGGHIAEDGSHDALLEKDGTYARLYRLQAAGYA
jgi:ATP-binding cassette subfamily B protein